MPRPKKPDDALRAELKSARTCAIKFRNERDGAEQIIARIINEVRRKGSLNYGEVATIVEAVEGPADGDQTGAQGKKGSNKTSGYPAGEKGSGPAAGAAGSSQAATDEGKKGGAKI